MDAGLPSMDQNQDTTVDEVIVRIANEISALPFANAKHIVSVIEEISKPGVIDDAVQALKQYCITEICPRD